MKFRPTKIMHKNENYVTFRIRTLGTGNEYGKAGEQRPLTTKFGFKVT